MQKCYFFQEEIKIAIRRNTLLHESKRTQRVSVRPVNPRRRHTHKQHAKAHRHCVAPPNTKNTPRGESVTRFEGQAATASRPTYRLPEVLQHEAQGAGGVRHGVGAHAHLNNTQELRHHRVETVSARQQGGWDARRATGGASAVHAHSIASQMTGAGTRARRKETKNDASKAGRQVERKRGNNSKQGGKSSKGGKKGAERLPRTRRKIDTPGRYRWQSGPSRKAGSTSCPAGGLRPSRSARTKRRLRPKRTQIRKEGSDARRDT